MAKQRKQRNFWENHDGTGVMPVEGEVVSRVKASQPIGDDRFKRLGAGLFECLGCGSKVRVGELSEHLFGEACEGTDD